MTRIRTPLTIALATLLGLAIAQGMMRTPSNPGTPGQSYGYGGYGMMQPGYGGYGPGGMGMMGGGMMGGSMMRVLPADAEPLEDEELHARLEAAARAFGPDVRVEDVMPFTDHSYAQIIGPDGTGLAELLIDRYTGVVTPEPGPNMMWNLRTGMGGYGMHGYGSRPWNATPDATEERITETDARDLAATFLDSYLPGAVVLAQQAFPGYATFDYGRDGRIDGMLSVHLGTGDVWPHTWHGAYRGDPAGHDD